MEVRGTPLEPDNLRRSWGRIRTAADLATLHLTQAAFVYINTHMTQIVLRDPAWRDRLTDRCGLSALFWTNLNLYGRFERGMSDYLDLGIEREGEACLRAESRVAR